jgi:multiple sugar transport system permease protein
MAVGSVSLRSGRRQIGRGWVIATYVALLVFTIWTVVPFLWMLLASLKTNKEIYQDFTLLPKTWYLGNYAQILLGQAGIGGGKASANFNRWLGNSAYVSVVTTALSIVLGSLGAYAITRLSFVGRSIMARGLIFTYLIPGTLLFIPLFQIVYALHLGDTLESLMLPYPPWPWWRSFRSRNRGTSSSTRSSSPTRSRRAL